MMPHGPRRRRRWLGRSLLAALLVAVVVGGYVGIKGVVSNFGAPSCRAVAQGQDETFSPEQMANAATIAAVAVRRDLPARAATIALATAIQESKLRNLTFGDRDSLGLFQQRPSQGWGSAAQIQDPVYSSNQFYDALVKVDGYQSMEITKVAQKVQHSGFPEAYADHEQQGRILASALTGNSPGGLGCRLKPATTSATPEHLAAQVTKELGMSAAGRAGAVTLTASSGQLAWAAGAWAVSHADAEGIVAVTVGNRTWTRDRDESGWSWHQADRAAASATAVRIELA